MQYVHLDFCFWYNYLKFTLEPTGQFNKVHAEKLKRALLLLLLLYSHCQLLRHGQVVSLSHQENVSLTTHSKLNDTF